MNFTCTQKHVEAICPHCFARYEIPPRKIGKTKQCPCCCEDFTIMRFLGISGISLIKLVLFFLIPFIRKCPGCGSKNHVRLKSSCQWLHSEHLIYHQCHDCNSMWAEESMQRRP